MVNIHKYFHDVKLVVNEPADPTKTFNQNITQPSSCQTLSVAVTRILPFIFPIFSPKCHKGGIFHQPLPCACCGMQTRWSKPAERVVSAVTVC